MSKANIKSVIMQLFNSPDFLDEIVNKLTDRIHQVIEETAAELKKKMDTMGNQVQSVIAKCDEQVRSTDIGTK